MTTTRLDVFRCETLGAQGRRHTHLTVSCPDREHVTSIDDCVACAHSSGLAVTDEGRVQVVCTPVEETAPSDGGRVRDAMSCEVVCVRADASLDDARALLLEHRISGMPVVDALGRPVGVLSQSDLLTHLHDHPPAVEVQQAMTTLAFTLPESAPLEQAAALMAYESIHRLPIVATDGRVIGVLSTLDVLRWLAEKAGYALPARR